MNHVYKVGDRIDLTADLRITAIPQIDDVSIDGVDVQKSLDYGEVEVIVSNSGLDRYGERILVEGIDLSQIRRNPVVLWAHDYQGLPIGQITKIWKDKEKNLKARIKLDYEIYDFANTVYQLILKGTIRAVSIGGLVLEFGVDEEDREDWNIVAKLEMVELSVVPVGAHPDALVVSKTLGIDEKDVKRQFREFLTRSIVDKGENLNYDNIQGFIESLKNITSALESSYKEGSADSDMPRIKRIKRLVLARSTAKLADRQTELLIQEINERLRQESDYGQKKSRP